MRSLYLERSSLALNGSSKFFCVAICVVRTSAEVDACLRVFVYVCDQQVFLPDIVNRVAREQNIP